MLHGAPKLMNSDAGIISAWHPYAWRDFGDTVADLNALATASGRWIRCMDLGSGLGDNLGNGTVRLERIF